jgi:hypothetical protein
MVIRLCLVSLACPAMCMFDKSHLTFNFKSKVSRDVFKNKNECQLTSTFPLLKCHLNVTCLVVCVVSSTCKVSINLWFFFPSQVTRHVKIELVRVNRREIHFYASFCASNIRNLQKLLSVKIHIVAQCKAKGHFVYMREVECMICVLYI